MGQHGATDSIYTSPLRGGGREGGPAVTLNLSMNLATLRNGSSFGEMVDDCLRHGVTAISPWRDQVAAVGLKEAARIVETNRLRVTGLCRGGMFPAETPAGRQANIDDNLKAIDEAAALHADCLVLVVGGLPGSSKDIVGARQMVRDGIDGYTLEVAQLSSDLPTLLQRLYEDRALRERLARAARERVVERFSMQSMVDEFASLMREREATVGAQ